LFFLFYHFPLFRVKKRRYDTIFIGFPIERIDPMPDWNYIIRGFLSEKR